MEWTSKLLLLLALGLQSYSLPAPSFGPGSKNANHQRLHSRSTSSRFSSDQSSQTEEARKEHVVLLSADSPHPEHVMARIGLDPSHARVKYTFHNSAFKGFAAAMHDDSVHSLSAMDDVSEVEEAVKVQSMSSPQPASQQGTTWGLQRISSTETVSGDPTSLQYTYSYDNGSLGQGVSIYVVDSGLNTKHVAFNGRARVGFSFEQDVTDQDGHGTHVSGTAAGAVLGVAPNADLIGVKVLGADGSGSSSDTVAGMDYVIRQHDAQKSQPGFVGSIMSMSWGLSSSSNTINNAITAASNSGIHVSVAAGNNGGDACAASPSQLGGANSDRIVTVGAVDEDDSVCTFSNTGRCVDIYAPGQNIVSAYKGTDNTVHSLSGTSMSTPHVTGYMAYAMSMDSSLASDPALLKSKLLSLAQKSAISGGTLDGDNRLLLNNGVQPADPLKGILP